MRRDDPDVFQLGPPRELPADPDTVIAALEPLITDERRKRIHDVIAARRLSVVPVLEGLTDPHNGSAVMRSADAFGLQEVHVIPGPHGFLAAHKVARGAHRWLDVILHADSGRCLGALKERGYRVVVAVMGGELRPEDLRSIERVAVVFGNEHAGASEVVRREADATCAVPMIGFVESLNVSVAAAITLYGASLGRPGDLSEAQRRELTARFLVSTVRDAAPIVREYAASR